MKRWHGLLLSLLSGGFFLMTAWALHAQKSQEPPLTQEGKLLSTLSNAKGSAPPVVQNVTFERLTRARTEPQNWLTYYGAYDGQRYSPLDQVNAEMCII